MIKALWFVRHGQSTANAAGVYGGATNVQLTDAGREQAVSAGKLLVDAGIELIVASPLDRARETAALIAGQIGDDPAAIRTDPDLCEIDSGRLTGTPDRGFTQFLAYVASGVDPTVDDPAKVAVRVRRVLERLAHDDAYDGRIVLVAAHAGIGRIMRSLLEGTSLEQLATVTVPNASPMELPLKRMMSGEAL